MFQFIGFDNVIFAAKYNAFVANGNSFDFRRVVINRRVCQVFNILFTACGIKNPNGLRHAVEREPLQNPG
jgi:hypothetical protein